MGYKEFFEEDCSMSLSQDLPPHEVEDFPYYEEIEEDEKIQQIEMDAAEFQQLIAGGQEKVEQQNPILLTFKTWLGRGIDKTFFIKCIEAGEEANLGYELMDLDTFPRNESGHLMATSEFWYQIYETIKLQQILKKEEQDGQRKIGF